MGNIPAACCAGEGGATSAEKQQGIAATGKFNQRIPMPENVWCQQMSQGSYPGNKFLQFTPAGVGALVAAKRAKELYINMKVDIDMDGGGQEVAGWSYAEIHEVVKRYKPDFAAKGIRVNFCLASYWDYSPNGKNYQDVTYRAWLEFADMSKATRGAREPKNAYDPKRDYADPPKLDGLPNR